MRLFASAFVLVAVISSVLARPAAACSCMAITLEEQLGFAEHAFAGRVIDIDRIDHAYRVRIEVRETFQGSTENRIEVTTALDSAGCGYRFEEGAEYLVFTNSSSDASELPSVSLCSRTAPVDRAAEDLAILREGLPEINRPSVDPGDNPLQAEIVAVSVHPNPFGDAAEVVIWLTAPSSVRVVLYDSAGREVATPLNASLPEGRHVARISGGELEAGVYHVRVSAGGVSQSIQVVHAP